MDLNLIRQREEITTQRTRLRAVRLPVSEEAEEDLVVFDGGEALPESQGEDIGHPISAEEAEVLKAEGWNTNDLALAATDYALHTGPDAMDRAMEDLRAGAESFVERLTNAPPEGWTRHHCVLECGFYLDVPPVQVGALGTPSTQSLEYQAEAEQRMVEHVEVHHGTAELIGALHQARRTEVMPKAMPVGVQHGFADVIPGPARRDPARQAAIDALDQRLGRGAPAAQDPQSLAEHDQRLREARARRRERQPSPYDLTPKYSAELGDGVVGIKR